MYAIINLNKKRNNYLKMKKRFIYRDVIETISYILLTCSVFYASYFSTILYLAGINIIVDRKYQFANYLFVFACVLYYKNSGREVIKEIIKSITILLFTNIIQFYLDGSGDIKKICILATFQLGYHLVAFIVIMVGVKNSEKLHGKRAELLLLIFLLLFGICFFILNINICATLIISVILDYIVGYRFYVMYINELKMKEENETKRIEIEKKKEIDNINTKNELDACKREKSIIEVELKKYKDKEKIQKSKRRRNRKSDMFK